MEHGAVIEGGYLRDILDQPGALHSAAEGFAADEDLRGLCHGFRDGRFRQVVLTGMGSSYHAFQPLLIEIAATGVPVTLVETSELIHYRPALLSPETLIVVLSQSGRSVETVRLLEQNASRSRLIAVTNDETSPLTACSDALILMHAGSEFTVSSKTYLASLAALAWLGSELRGDDAGRVRAELSALAPAAEAYLAGWREHVERAARELEAAERLYYVGRGPSLATTGTAGLITKESARFTAEGMSAAAFRHGPLELVDPRTFVLAFEGAPQTAALNARLARDVKLAGGRAALVRESEEPSLFHTPPVAGRLRPVLEILPVQMITLALAAMAGHEAGAFAHASKVTVTE